MDGRHICAAVVCVQASGEVTVDDKSISVTAECMASGASRESVCGHSHTTLMALTIQRAAQPTPDNDDP